jgi:3-oxoacyl-[acyl-carrier protein] reductase
VINCRERVAAAEAVASRVTASGRGTVAVAADVSDSAAVIAMTRIVTDKLGPIDILINNVGIALIRGIDDLTRLRGFAPGKCDVGSRSD